MAITIGPSVINWDVWWWTSLAFLGRETRWPAWLKSCFFTGEAFHRHEKPITMYLTLSGGWEASRGRKTKMANLCSESHYRLECTDHSAGGNYDHLLQAGGRDLHSRCGRVCAAVVWHCLIDLCHQTMINGSAKTIGPAVTGQSFQDGGQTVYSLTQYRCYLLVDNVLLNYTCYSCEWYLIWTVIVNHSSNVS